MQTADDPVMLPHIEYRDERSYERERAQSYYTAALMGYGALLARNVDRQYDMVLEAMAKSLWPDKQP